MKWFYVCRTHNMISENDTTRNEGIVVVSRFLSSLLSMLCSIMAPSTNEKEIQECERYIQSYLSDLNKLDIWIKNSIDGYNTNNSKPIWLTKYNFQSLMNVPSAMRYFGPLRNYWEGSMQGEGYLKVVKPKIDNLKTKNWHVNAHTKILEDHVFDRVLLDYTKEKHENGAWLEYNKMKYIRKHREMKMVYIYKTVHDVESLLNKRKPISFVQLIDGRYVIVLSYSKKGKMSFIEIKLNYVASIDDIKMNLHSMNIEVHKEDVDLDTVKKDSMQYYLIALPVKCNSFGDAKENNDLYYVISANWMEIDEYGAMAIPKII